MGVWNSWKILENLDAVDVLHFNAYGQAMVAILTQSPAN
uniref:Uncharacterized protein n=1 Tax=Onchocerca volvulus TaxID=6282 RepID=A0A8R1XYT0_ONCVO